MKRIVKTESCQVAHLGYVASGGMHIVMEDGLRATRGRASWSHGSGHDAWIVGDEPCVFIDFPGASNYAKQ